MEIILNLIPHFQNLKWLTFVKSGWILMITDIRGILVLFITNTKSRFKNDIRQLFRIFVRDSGSIILNFQNLILDS